MNTTIVEMRHAMKDVLGAVERNEPVNVLYHGRKKAVILNPSVLENHIKKDVCGHPFFGMRKADKESVDSTINRLRGTRFNDL